MKSKYPIKGWVKNSFCDWDGRICSVFFLPVCNFRCPFCQNWDLVTKSESFADFDWTEIKKYLFSNKEFIDGIVVTGGEPCMFSGLEDLLKDIRETGFKIKIDTNGFFPEKIERLLAKNLIDSIAMDVKNSINLDDYKKTVGEIDNQGLENIRASIKLVKSSGIDYEFRTTVIPLFHSISNIKDIGRYLNRAKKYILQGYRKAGVNPEFVCDKVYSRAELEIFRKEVEKFFDECRIRMQD